MHPDKPGFSTNAIHAGYTPTRYDGALNTPIFCTSAYAFDSAEQAAARIGGKEEGMVYSRGGNPTVRVLEERLAILEGAQAAVALASGMGAISTLAWTLLRPGDELLVDVTLYSGTQTLVNSLLPEFGIVTKIADFTRPDEVGASITRNTALVLFESLTNPNMRMVDIKAISETVREHSEALIAVDNTYCTPYLQRPLDFGADIVLHSLTKYINGHGDVIAGIVMGSAEVVKRVRTAGMKNSTGACLSPVDAYLILRGLKTLTIRMDRHCHNAQIIAEYLERSSSVKKVHYPGLQSYSQYDLARRQMKQPGGMIAFELKGGIEAGRKFINSLRLFTRSLSLGDAESLALHPASMMETVYAQPGQPDSLIDDGLVRLSVGLENVEDLLADLEQALNVLA
ncbi:trans-sulfuration enzyme family protein [Paraburkholderia sp.]|jgi:methionine-gamma-lyase|uniref:trans-sulfuration enzyme family protein n=1 Tax=Paraburkholderia sp. TaxID=1926495 RepID=UPI002F3F26E0